MKCPFTIHCFEKIRQICLKGWIFLTPFGHLIQIFILGGSSKRARVFCVTQLSGKAEDRTYQRQGFHHQNSFNKPFRSPSRHTPVCTPRTASLTRPNRTLSRSVTGQCSGQRPNLPCSNLSESSRFVSLRTPLLLLLFPGCIQVFSS